MDERDLARRASQNVPALAYLRVSGRGQVDGDGFPRQRDAIHRYARSHDIEVVGEYRDEGVSGTRELDDRQGLSNLIGRVRANGVRTVLIERADRLARDLLVGEVILNQFRDLSVTVIAVDSGTDLTAQDDDPTRVLIRQVLGAVSQFEKCVLVIKLRAARVRKRRANGRCEGRKPFGTRAGEGEVLARIAELRRACGAQRASYATIARELNAERRPTRSGRPWRAGTVQRIVRRLGTAAVTPSTVTG